MAKAVEFYFDFGSPTSYLAWTQLPRLAAEAGALLVWRPMLLGGVFQATGNHSPVTVPATAPVTVPATARSFTRSCGLSFDALTFFLALYTCT